MVSPPFVSYTCTHNTEIIYFMSVCSSVQNLGRPYWLTLSPMYLWMLVFFTRPHKEERFLFPIYPLICLCGAVALSSLQVCDKVGINGLYLFITVVDGLVK